MLQSRENIHFDLEHQRDSEARKHSRKKVLFVQGHSGRFKPLTVLKRPINTYFTHLERSNEANKF